MLWVLTVLGIITNLSDDTGFVFPIVHHLLLCCSVNFEARTCFMLPVSEHEHTCVPFCDLRICFMGPVASNALQSHLTWEDEEERWGSF